MRASLLELAALVGGEVVGDPATTVTGFAPAAQAGAGEITFAAGEAHRELARRSGAAAIVTSERIEGTGSAQVLVGDPNLAFARIVRHLLGEDGAAPPGVHETAVIDAGAEVDPSAAVHPFVTVARGAVVGPRTVLHPGVVVGAGARIGADCVIHANVVVMHRVRIGDRVVIHAGAVIGSDGFGYATNAEGEHEKIPQVGTVVIEDDVEIGSCTCVDRARFEETRIGRGTKIDNLVQVAHNVTVGPHCLIAAHTGVAGSSRLGHHVVLGGHVGITGHIAIGDGAQVAAFSGVGKSLEGGQGYLGLPAQPFAAGLRTRAVQRRLPELYERLKRLEAAVARLEGGAGGAGA